MPTRRKSSPDESPAGKKKTLIRANDTVTGASPALVTDLRQLILSAREQVARAVDSGLVLLYWSIGHRIRTDVLKEKRAEYGEKILHAVSAKLVAEFGQGFTERNLANMTRFAEEFPDPKIVHALSGQLSWTHFRRIIYLDDPLKREFYAEMCRIEKWNTRTLHQKIQSMLYERTALSKKPDKLIATELKKLRDEDKLTPDLVFRDPYVLDFLGLKDTYAEIILQSHSTIREFHADPARTARLYPALPRPSARHPAHHHSRSHPSTRTPLQILNSTRHCASHRNTLLPTAL